MIKVVIYSSNEIDFEKSQKFALNSGLLKENIIFCNSNQTSREEVIETNINRWLLFIDSDCCINSELIENIKNLIITSEKNTDIVYAGYYRNPQGSHYLQRVHNFIANLWLEESFINNNSFPYILGGVFLIFNTGKHFQLKKHNNFWGGEDKFMSYQLFKYGFQILNAKQLQIEHATNPSVIHFLRRAWLHGLNEGKHFNFMSIKKNYYFMIRKVGLSNLNLLPLILIHFCIQRAALLIQKILQTNKK